MPCGARARRAPRAARAVHEVQEDFEDFRRVSDASEDFADAFEDFADVPGDSRKELKRSTPGRVSTNGSRDIPW